LTGTTPLFANRPRILEPLYKRNVVPTEEQLRALECEVKNKFDEILEHGGKPDRGFWSMFYTRLFEELRLSDENLRQQLIENTRISANWDQMRPGTREALDRIGKKYRIAVISNADGKIAECLEGCDWRSASSPSQIQGVVGHEKPHPVILRPLSVRAVLKKAYVATCTGDYPEPQERDAGGADVAGAYRDKGLPRESMEELVAMIG
jgi:FMN phosphatase YigB (HAD superfamily)